MLVLANQAAGPNVLREPTGTLRDHWRKQIGFLFFKSQDFSKHQSFFFQKLILKIYFTGNARHIS